MPRGCAIVLIVLASLFALFMGGCAFLAYSVANLDIGPKSRQHLQPIPVSTKTCPYVRVMHAAANNFERVDPFAFLAVNPSKAAWPSEQRRLAAALNVLEFAVVASRAQFPEPIQVRLGVVLENIRSSRTDLAAAHSAAEVVERTSGRFDAGQTAFGEASDLIGDACPVHLAAG